MNDTPVDNTSTIKIIHPPYDNNAHNNSVQCLQFTPLVWLSKVYEK